MEIYLKDLKSEKQEQILKEFGLDCAEDGNLDISPLLIVEPDFVEVPKRAKEK